MNITRLTLSIALLSSAAAFANSEVVETTCSADCTHESSVVAEVAQETSIDDIVRQAELDFDLTDTESVELRSRLDQEGVNADVATIVADIRTKNSEATAVEEKAAEVAEVMI